jgi:beta-glucosidase
MTKRYENLLAALDVPARVRLLTGASMFTLHGDERIGLAPMAFSDGPTGVRGLKWSGGPQASLLPNATLLASTWDEDLFRDVGRLLAEEAIRQQIHVVLGPTINLHRSPLGGRLFEAFSEDPLVTGRLAGAYVRGLQSSGIGACLKHLVANESETERDTVDSQVDEATLRELYLLPFQIAVEDSDPWSIMAAYNDVNGVPATEQDAVINGIVKGEWSWPGLVMSDWFATKSTAPAANGGLDLVMPGPDGPWGDALVRAVEAGEVTESVIDDHVERLLRLADRVGALGTPRSWPVEVPGPTDRVRRDALARYAAAGMTVLANGGSLPLAEGARVALIGRPAVDTALMGGGSAQVNPPHRTSIADGLCAVRPGTVVVDGVEVRDLPVRARPGFVVDPVDGRPGIHLQLYAADGELLADEQLHDAQRVVGVDDDLPRPATRARLTASVEHAGRVQLGVIGLGSWTLTAGSFSGTVTLRPLTGDHGEGLLIPPTHTMQLELDGPTVVEAEVTVEEGIGPHRGVGIPTGLVTMVGLIARPAPRPDAEVIAEAVAAARSTDVAVVVVGLTEEQETEARDKHTLALPGAQDALVEAVAAAAPRTVVVVNAATPVLMPWADRVDAILAVGLPGQEGGTAVAAVLTGALEPAGRLVTTWPAADGATPAWSVTPVEGGLAYSEGPFIGYRGHAAGRAPAPRFWFGHGLGYSTWEYGDPRVEAGDVPVVTVPLRNTGTRTSREVVQVYFAPADEAHPVRLVGWATAAVAAGDSATVRVISDERMWRAWDADAGRWAALDRTGELLLARGLGDVRARIPIPER